MRKYGGQETQGGGAEAPEAAGGGEAEEVCGEEVRGASSRELEVVTLLAPQTIPHQGVPRLATKKK